MREDSNWIALVGAPNSGKTTLYNWLTNSRFKTVNYPGATVEIAVGHIAPQWSAPAELSQALAVDTPGTYSLFPKSEDEEVTYRTVFLRDKFQKAPRVICVVDGTQMTRHLLLAKQLQEAGASMVIAVTMKDLLQKNKIQIDLDVLRQEYNCPVVLIDGVLGGGISELIQAVAGIAPSEKMKPLQQWTSDQMSAHFRRIEDVAKRAVHSKVSFENDIKPVYARTEKLDRWFLHPIFGVVLFATVMATLFSMIFWAAAPLMDLVDGAFASVNEMILAQGPGSLLFDFLGNGVIASFGAVFVFVPQIFILFLGIGLLESSGYLARAATLIDRPFSAMGLSGRSFVPLLSGFACAVPAMMATRNISSRKERLMTNFIIPLMQCSARLPVYALLLAFLFKDAPAWQPGLALTGIYLFSMVISAGAATVLNRMIKMEKMPALFMMELPIYRLPKAKVLLRATLGRTLAYVKRAGPIIFVFAVLIWCGTTFPNYQLEGHDKLQSSYLGRAGQVIEPIFKPMGVDWRVGVGLLSAFAAREVFVSSMAVMFNVTAEDEDGQLNGVLTAMQQATFADGSMIFTFGSVLGLILFFMVALQCMSTVAMSVRENHSVKFAVTQLVAFNLLAYVLAVTVVQLFHLWG